MVKEAETKIFQSLVEIRCDFLWSSKKNLRRDLWDFLWDFLWLNKKKSTQRFMRNMFPRANLTGKSKQVYFPRYFLTDLFPLLFYIKIVNKTYKTLRVAISFKYEHTSIKITETCFINFFLFGTSILIGI